MDRDIKILVAMAIALGMVLTMLWYMGKKELAKKIVLSLVLSAEREYGAGAGPVKYASVVGKIYPLLPTVVKLFVNEDQLSEWVEDGVKRMKLLLEPGTDTKQNSE